jgi:hypothetical protein
MIDFKKLVPQSLIDKAILVYPLIEEEGFANLAWTKNDLLQVLELIEKEKRIAVLGGDVLSYDEKNCFPIVATWFCERLLYPSVESLQSFAMRSIIYTENYVSKHFEQDKKLFLLVLSSEETVGLDSF